MISVDFTEIGLKVDIQLDSSQSPKTVKKLLSNLPMRVLINRWGDELYTDPTPVVADEENAYPVVDLNDFAYWPKGRALCLFFGKTPISKDGKILPYSPVNIIGKILVPKDKEVCQFLSDVEESHTKRKIPVQVTVSG